MYLTPENAKEYVGMRLYASKSIFHIYPITVFQYPDGTYATRDRAGVCSPVSNIKFNQIWFDSAEPQVESEDIL